MTELPELHRFEDPDSLAAALAERVAGQLREGLAARERALLAVSGGSTPVKFFEHLARVALDWSRVDVTLVDERWVDANHDRSNARLVARHLLTHEAAAAHFVPLYTERETPEAAIADVRARIDALARPFDAVILGMGDDGHTASFFPGGDRLDEALDLSGTASVLPMRAAHAGEPRITLSLPTLLDTRALILHIQGEAKHRVLADAAAAHGNARFPVHAVLAQTRVPLDVYWCP